MAEHTVRLATMTDLDEMLALYRHLYSDDPIIDPEVARAEWAKLISSGLTTVFAATIGDKPVSSCTLIVVPNVTRGGRPYALIENVVTHADHRRRGLGRAVLDAALSAAQAAACYKVMLATGSRQEETLRFYESAGFVRGEKTFFQISPPQ